ELESPFSSASRDTAKPGRQQPSTSPPPSAALVFRNTRRVRWVILRLLMLRLLSHHRRAMYRAPDPLVRATPAYIRHIGVDVLVSRMTNLRKHCRGGHDLSGLTITALRNLFRYPRLLQRMGAVRRQTFYRDYGLPCGGRSGDLTGANRLPVEVDSTGPTLAQ